MAEYLRSGKSRPKFCRERGICYTSLCGWLRNKPGKKAVRGFHRVKISPLMGFGEPVMGEIVLGGGVRVRVMRGCTVSEVATMMEGLGCARPEAGACGS